MMLNAVIRFHFRAMFFIATIFGEREEVKKTLKNSIKVRICNVVLKLFTYQGVKLSYL